MYWDLLTSPQIDALDRSLPVILETFGFRHRDCQLVILTWWRLVAAELEPLNETGPGGVGHACEFETSLMLHIAPDLVRMDKVSAPQNTTTYLWAEVAGNIYSFM